jgi:hypothetical protein
MKVTMEIFGLLAMSFRQAPPIAPLFTIPSIQIQTHILDW